MSDINKDKEDKENSTIEILPALTLPQTNNNERPASPEEKVPEEVPEETEPETFDTNDDTDDDTMTSSTTKVPPLTKDNYASWRIWIESILDQQGLWLDLDGDHAATANYAEIVKRAYHIIVLRCDAEHAMFAKSVGEYDSVKTLIALRTKYEGSGVMSKIELLQRALLMKHQGGEIDKHIDDMRMCWQRLNEKGGIKPELMQVANLMISLSPDMGNVMTAFINTKEDDLKFEEVASAIISEQRRRAISHESTSPPACDATALASQQTNKRDLVCSFCSKRGHHESHCYQKPGNPRYREPKDDNSNKMFRANIALTAQSHEATAIERPLLIL